ncbi:MAG: ABC transporter substrate-binding protein [Microcoleus sp. SIO2G3]|nr:ABC transporter substrate-binding protein [Microcoleus sp. SIO2G3]
MKRQLSLSMWQRQKRSYANLLQKRAGFVAEVEALLQGQVDAIYVKGAVGIDLAQSHQLKTIVDLGTHPDPLIRVNNGTPRTVTVNAELIEQRPDLVVQYLTCLLETAAWAETQPDQVVKVVAAETGSGEAGVRTAYGTKLHQRLHPDSSPQWIEGLTAHKDFLLRWGFIQHDFEIDRWIDPAPLAAAKQRVKHSSPASFISS